MLPVVRLYTGSARNKHKTFSLRRIFKSGCHGKFSQYIAQSKTVFASIYNSDVADIEIIILNKPFLQIHVIFSFF